MEKIALSIMLFGFVTSSITTDASERCARCKRTDCEYSSDGNGYNPYQHYYPFCLIYQDSKVKTYDSDFEQNYWPAKRDDDLVDALTR